MTEGDRMRATVARRLNGPHEVIVFAGGPLAHPYRFHDVRGLPAAWRWAGIRGVIPLSLSYEDFYALVPTVGADPVELPEV